MIPTFNSFKSVARAAVLAVAIGGSALAVMPAQAQEGPSASFSIQIPGNGPATNGRSGASATGRFAAPGWAPDYGYDDGYGYDYGYRCLTNREVRQGIAGYGFSNVDITRELYNNRVDLQAVYGNWLYTMRVDKCTGEVNRVRQAQRVYNGGYNNGGGFGFQFGFGN
ncbi:hypothetical protein WH87_07360 [Devosia epidermidihirudinis]|uniref:Uncharacterized protein n=1 Tax=Devosia epidermidihirudinis TaxID=1293439 RepID=A0A0F5QDE6_9HYPH|nr:hypothetical protein [Devosia epidermidihirudinis]KKC38733.1 hypothetical protein WH87_07360 [Devosia epidermidihirudinis]